LQPGQVTAHPIPLLLKVIVTAKIELNDSDINKYWKTSKKYWKTSKKYWKTSKKYWKTSKKILENKQNILENKQKIKCVQY
jgi:hypothetical protein